MLQVRIDHILVRGVVNDVVVLQIIDRYCFVLQPSVAVVVAVVVVVFAFELALLALIGFLSWDLTRWTQ